MKMSVPIFVAISAYSLAFLLLLIAAHAIP